MDFGTLGSAVAWLFVTVSETVIKTGVGEGTKNAYKALSDRIVALMGPAPKAPAPAELVEDNEITLAAEIDRQPPAARESIRMLAASLTDLLIADKASQTPIGLEIEKLRAAHVRLSAITVTEGVGVRFKDVNTPGDFTSGPISVGPQLGKPKG